MWMRCVIHSLVGTYEAFSGRRRTQGVRLNPSSSAAKERIVGFKTWGQQDSVLDWELALDS